MSADLAAFLKARLDEDAAVAHAAAAMPGGVPGERWRVSGSHEDDGGTYWSITTGTPDLVQTIELVGSGMSGGGAHTEEVALHIVRHDPARVLAEVEAKRQTLDLHRAEWVDTGDADGNDRSGYFCAECDVTPFPCRTLRLLALPYASHPEYRTAWAPTA